MNRKQKILRKLLSVSLAAAMTVGGAAVALPAMGGEGPGITVNAAAKTENGFYYHVSAYMAYVEGIVDGSEKDIVIPETLGGCPVVKIYPDAFAGNKTIESVTIPKGVSVGNAAFSGCTALKEVKFEGDNDIDWYGFKDCTGLEYIDLSNVSYMGKESFRGCTSLRSVTFSDDTTELYDGAFMDCSALTAVKLPKNIRKLNYRAFANCTSLKTIEVAAMDDWGYWTFEGCTNVETVKLGDDVGYVPFEFLPDTPKLTTVELGKGVKAIDSNAFSNSGLKKIVIPDNVNFIGSYAFHGCSELTDLTLPAGLSNVCNDAFEDTPLAVEENGAVYVGTLLCGWSGANKTINVKDGTTAICNAAFAYNENIEKVVLPESVTAIGSQAFSNCKNLSSVSVGSKLLHVGEDAFSETPWLDNQTTDVYLGKVFLKQKENKSRVLLVAGTTAIADGAFAGDEAIRSVRLVNALKVIGRSAFANCSNFSGLVFTSRVSEIGAYAFEGTKVKSVTLPASIKQIGYRAFPGAEEIVIPDGLKAINDDMFSGSRSLKKIVIPEGVTSVGKRAFSDCPEVEEISLPSTLKTIGDYAFYDSTKIAVEQWFDENVVSSNEDEVRASYALRSVTVPASVTSIGLKALGYCKYGRLTGFKMYGTRGSAAEKYAFANEISFNDEYIVEVKDTQIERCYQAIPAFRFNLIPAIYTNDYKIYYKRYNAAKWTLAGQGQGTTLRLRNAGLYDLRVVYTDNNGTEHDEEFYTSVATTEDITNLSTVSADTVTPGTRITINGAASGGTGAYGYQYYYKKSTARSWSCLENEQPSMFFGDENGNAYISATQQTLTLRNKGAYDIKVVAYDPGLDVTSEKIMRVAVTTGDALSNDSTIVAEEVNVGTRVYINGAASGGTGVYTYTYSYKKSSALKWNVIGAENTTEKTASFRPGTSGGYDVRVVVTDADGKSIEKTFNVQVI